MRTFKVIDRGGVARTVTSSYTEQEGRWYRLLYEAKSGCDSKSIDLFFEIQHEEPGQRAFYERLDREDEESAGVE